MFDVLLEFVGTTKTYPNNGTVLLMGVKDVTMAHILAYESTHATNRNICCNLTIHLFDLVALLTKMYPTYPICAK
jgi:hypothetical protein